MFILLFIFAAFAAFPRRVTVIICALALWPHTQTHHPQSDRGKGGGRPAHMCDHRAWQHFGLIEVNPWLALTIFYAWLPFAIPRSPFPVPRSHSLPCDSFRFDSFSISLLLLMLLLCPLNLRHKTQSGKQTNKQANRHIDKQTNKQNRRANIFIKSPATTPMRKASPFACFLCCDSAQLETPNWILEVGYCVRVVGGVVEGATGYGNTCLRTFYANFSLWEAESESRIRNEACGMRHWTGLSWTLYTCAHIHTYAMYCEFALYLHMAEVSKLRSKLNNRNELESHVACGMWVLLVS